LQRRSEIIKALELLADVRFQYDTWVRHAPSQIAPSFNDLIADLYDIGDVRGLLARPVKTSGLTSKEHHALANAVAIIDKLLEDHPSDETDEAILQDSRWPQIRIAAGRAAKILREGE
jgi:hypothetical protein